MDGRNVAKESGFQFACGDCGAVLGAPQTGEIVSLYHQASGFRETIVNDALREYPLSGQNALQRWTTHVIFEPLAFIAKLAALVPKPESN
jgi:hypothetical protein